MALLSQMSKVKTDWVTVRVSEMVGKLQYPANGGFRVSGLLGCLGLGLSLHHMA